MAKRKKRGVNTLKKISSQLSTVKRTQTELKESDLAATTALQSTKESLDTISSKVTKIVGVLARNASSVKVIQARTDNHEERISKVEGDVYDILNYVTDPKKVTEQNVEEEKGESIVAESLGTIATNLTSINASFGTIENLLVKSIEGKKSDEYKKEETALETKAQKLNAPVRVDAKSGESLFSAIKGFFTNPAVIAAFSGLVYLFLPKDIKENIHAFFRGFMSAGDNTTKELSTFEKAVLAAGTGLGLYFGAKLLTSAGEAAITLVKLIGLARKGLKRMGPVGAAAAVAAVATAGYVVSKRGGKAGTDEDTIEDDEDEVPAGTPPSTQPATPAAQPQTEQQKKPTPAATQPAAPATQPQPQAQTRPAPAATAPAATPPAAAPPAAAPSRPAPAAAPSRPAPAAAPPAAAPSRPSPAATAPAPTSAAPPSPAGAPATGVSRPPAAASAPQAPSQGAGNTVQNDIPTEADQRGKFGSASAFNKALYPYAELASQKLGGKIPPTAILAQWSKETGGGKAISGRYNYAGIYNFGMFPESDEVYTEERFTPQQLEAFRNNPAKRDRLVKVYSSDDETFPYEAKKGKTIGKFYSLQGDAVTKARAEGKIWVTLKSPFAKFKNLRDFTEGYVRVLSNPRYKQVLEQTTAESFAKTLVSSGYATANASSYGSSVASIAQGIDQDRLQGIQTQPGTALAANERGKGTTLASASESTNAPRAGSSQTIVAGSPSLVKGDRGQKPPPAIPTTVANRGSLDQGTSHSTAYVAA